jgi:hypothetical protein
VDATTAGGKSIGFASALVLMVHAAVSIVVAAAADAIISYVGMVPKRPPVPEFGFSVDPAAGAIFVSRIVVRVVIVGITEFRGQVVYPCWMLLLLILVLLLLPRLGHATLRQDGRLGDLLCCGFDGHLAEGVGTDPAIFGDCAQFVGGHLVSEVRQMQRQRGRERLQLQRWIIRRSGSDGDFVPVVIDRDWR